MHHAGERPRRMLLDEDPRHVRVGVARVHDERQPGARAASMWMRKLSSCTAALSAE